MQLHLWSTKETIPLIHWINVKDIAMTTMIVTESYVAGRERKVNQSPQVVPGRLTLQTGLIVGTRYSQSRWSTKEPIPLNWVNVKEIAMMTVIAGERE